MGIGRAAERGLFMGGRGSKGRFNLRCSILLSHFLVVEESDEIRYCHTHTGIHPE